MRGVVKIELDKTDTLNNFFFKTVDLKMLLDRFWEISESSEFEQKISRKINLHFERMTLAEFTEMSLVTVKVITWNSAQVSRKSPSFRKSAQLKTHLMNINIIIFFYYLMQSDE